MSLAEVAADEVVQMARKTIQKSGNRFFQAVLSRTNEFIESTLASTLEAEDFESATSMCTSDNLILLSRYYAGEISKPKKRSRRHTLYDQVKEILSNSAAAKALNVIFLAAYLDAAQDECEARACHAEEAEEFWAQSYAEEDPVDMWNRRSEAIDLAKESWDNAADAAMSKDWDSFASALTDLMEVEA